MYSSVSMHVVALLLVGCFQKSLECFMDFMDSKCVTLSGPWMQ